MMKKAFLFQLFCLVLITSSFGQHLRGFISYQNSGGRAAVGVKVSSYGATSVFTDDTGMFKLVFSNTYPGDKVRLSIGETDGGGKEIEVVNNKVLEFLNLPSNGNSNPIEIVVANPVEREKAVRRYYGILETGVNKRYEELIQLLQKDNIADETIAVLTKELEKLRLEKDIALSRVGSQADFLASINLDQSLTLVKEAVFELNSSNDIQAAINVLTPKELQKIYRNFKGQGWSKKITLDQILEAHQVRTELLISSFRYREAVETFQAMITIVEDNQLKSLEVASLFCKCGDLLSEYGDKEDAYQKTSKGVHMLRELGDQGIFNSELFTCYSSLWGLEYDLGLKEGPMDFTQMTSFLLDTLFKNPAFIEYARDQDYRLEFGSGILDSISTFLGFFEDMVKMADICGQDLNNEVDKLSEDCLLTTERFFLELPGYIDFFGIGEMPCWFAGLYRMRAEVYGYQDPAKYVDLIEESIQQFSLDKYKQDYDCQLDIAQYLYLPFLSQEGLDWFESPYFTQTLQMLVRSPDSLYEKVVEVYRDLSYIISDTHEKYISLGEYFLQTGINILEENLHENDPKLVRPYRQMGNLIEDTCIDDKECLQAVKWYLKVLRIQENALSPDHEDLAFAYYSIAEVYRSMSDSNYLKALEYYEACNAVLERAAVQNDSRISDNNKEIAKIYFMKHNYEKALQYFELATHRYQSDTTFLCDKERKRNLEELVESFVWQSEEKENLFGWNYQDTLDAIKYTEALLEQYITYDSCLLGLQDYEKVQTSYYSFFLLDAIKFLGKIYLQRREFPKAKNAFIQYDYFEDRAAGSSNRFYEAASILNWVNYYYVQKNYEKTFEILKTAVPGKYNYLFAQIRKDTDFKELANDSRFIDLNNFMLQVNKYDSLANDAFRRGEYSAAINYFDKLNTLSPKADSWNFAGLSYYYLRNYDKALEHYEEAHKIDPGIEEGYFYNNVGMAYVNKRKFKKAFSAFEKYEKKFPDRGRTYRNWAMYYAVKGEKDKALQNIQKAVDLGYSDLYWLNSDESMMNLKEDENFINILDELEAKLKQQKRD